MVRAESEALSHAKAPGRVVVIIPAHNAESTIGEQLFALQAQDSDALDEVVVVNSASTDSTPDLVLEAATRWPKVRLVHASGPGANRARNEGVRQSRAERILWCDADDVVGAGWVVALDSALDQHALVRGRYELERLNPRDLIASRGTIASSGPPPDGEPVDGLGGNCGTHRWVWTKLGGLNEEHYGADDAELFWRAHREGLDVGYAHNAVVHYRLRSGWRPMYRQQRTWAESRALLYREFRDSGFIQRRSTAQALKSWVWLVGRSFDCRSSDPVRRGRWVRVAATCLGNTRGSIRHRVFFP